MGLNNFKGRNVKVSTIKRELIWNLVELHGIWGVKEEKDPAK